MLAAFVSNAGERHLLECIIECHGGRTPGVMVWGATAYHGRFQLLRILGNLNRYISEVQQLQAVPFLQSLLDAVFQQNNARPHIARTVQSFFSMLRV